MDPVACAECGALSCAACAGVRCCALCGSDATPVRCPWLESAVRAIALRSAKSGPTARRHDPSSAVAEILSVCTFCVVTFGEGTLYIHLGLLPDAVTRFIADFMARLLKLRADIDGAGVLRVHCDETIKLAGQPPVAPADIDLTVFYRRERKTTKQATN